MRESLLSQMAQQRTLRPLDLQFATLLAGPQQLHLALAAAPGMSACRWRRWIRRR